MTTLQNPATITSIPTPDGLELAIWGQWPQAVFDNYARGFKAEPFSFWFDLRGAAIILICKWGTKQGSRWAWGHCTPHRWGEPIGATIRPSEFKTLVVSLSNLVDGKIKTHGTRFFEWPDYSYNPFVKIASELKKNPYNDDEYIAGVENYIHERMKSLEERNQRQAEKNRSTIKSLEHDLSVVAKYGGKFYDKEQG